MDEGVWRPWRRVAASSEQPPSAVAHGRAGACPAFEVHEVVSRRRRRMRGQRPAFPQRPFSLIGRALSRRAGWLAMLYDAKPRRARWLNLLYTEKIW